jgi:hypothetical protein
VKSISELHGPRPAGFLVLICQLYVPFDRLRPGTYHAHWIEQFASALLNHDVLYTVPPPPSFISNQYFVAAVTAFHWNTGEPSEIVPEGEINVAAPGAPNSNVLRSPHPAELDPLTLNL